MEDKYEPKVLLTEQVKTYFDLDDQKVQEIEIQNRSSIKLVYKMETKVQLKDKLLLRAIYIQDDLEEQMTQMCVDVSQPKKYKIVFPIIFDINQIKNAYELLQMKAILTEILYKGKPIYRKLMFVRPLDSQNQYQLKDELVPETKEKDQDEKQEKENDQQENEENEEFEEGEELEELEELEDFEESEEEIDDDLSEQQLLKNYYDNQKLKDVQVEYPYLRYKFQISLVNRGEGEQIFIDQE